MTRHMPRWRMSAIRLTAFATLLASGVLVTYPQTADAAPLKERRVPAIESPAPKKRAPQGRKGEFAQAPDAKGRVPALPADTVPRAGFDPKGKRVVGRTAETTTYDNGDGTSTLLVHGGPVNFEDRTGTWRQIDARLHREEGGGVVNGAGPVSARFAGRTGGDLVTLSGEGWSLSAGLDGIARGRSPRVDGATVTYEEVLPGVDLEKAMGNDRLKETFVLRAAPPRPLAETLRSPLTLDGLTPSTAADGSIVFTDGAGRTRLTIPVGVATDSSRRLSPGTGLTPRAPVVPKLVETADGWAVDLVLPTEWLNDEGRVYPVYIDPSYTWDAGVSPRQSSGYDQNVGSGCGNCYYDGSNSVEGNAYVNRIGYQNFAGSTTPWEFYSYLNFDVSRVYNHTVTSAFFHGHTFDGGFFRTYPVGAPWSIGMDWDHRVGHACACSVDQNIADHTSFSFNITSWVAKWADRSWGAYGLKMDTGGQSSYVQLAAMEQAWQGYDPYVSIVFENTPANWPTTSQLTPGDKTVTTNATPTLSSAAMTDAEGDPVSYWFRVATGTDAESGQVVSSGWITPGSGVAPQFAIPAGALQNGVTYYWKVFTWDGYGPPLHPPGTPFYSSWPPVSLKVDLRLGDRKSPVDDVGAVDVNLATGNVGYGYASPTIPSVGGPIGLSYTYNSKAEPAYGLTGTYYDGCTVPPEDMPPDGAQQKMVRRDPAINFSWASPPATFVASTNYCVQWTGYITFPYQANNWLLGAASDDGIRIKLAGVNGTSNETTVLNRWANGYTPPGSAFTGSTTFSTFGPNQTVPITIDYFNGAGPGSVNLYVAGPVNFELPPSWLTPSIGSMPQGWSVTGGSGADLTYASAKVTDNAVVLTEPDGSTHEYQKSSSGSTTVYKPTRDGDAYVTQDPGGNLVVEGGDGIVYTFNGTGKLISAVTARDDTRPAAPVYAYDTGSGRLATITDPASGRVIRLTYQADPNGTTPDATCPSATGFSRAPGGMLCSVDYGDAAHTRTNLYYNANGQIARFEEWRSDTNTSDTEITDLGYDAAGRLASIRDPLGSDTVAAGLRTDNATNTTARTLIAYDASGRASSVTLPAPASATDARPAHTYTYTSSTETRVHVAGASPAVGYARRVVFDSKARLTDDYDAAGLRTRTIWDDNDSVTATIAPSGLQTATVYDGDHPVGGGHPRHMPTDVYGPAPQSCFNAPDSTGKVTVNGSCTNPAVARSRTAYDEGITGLAVTYFAGSTPSGAPKKHDTGLHDPQGRTNATWTSAPFGLPANNWSLRMTGEINLAAGQYTFDVYRWGGARLTIDDQIVVDAWTPSTAGQAFYSNPITFATAGWHRIMVDFRSATSGTSKLEVQWTPPGGTQDDIPESATSPGYNLVTSKTDADGKKVAFEYRDVLAGIGPEYGLTTATVTDPAGLALRRDTRYETPSATTYVRPLSRTMPKGTGTATTMAYYASGDTAPANDCGGGVSLGMLKQETSPTPATGSAITRQFVYDALNRTVGKRVVGDQFWSCTTYDARGRITSSRDSKGVTTTNNYSVPGQVTVSFNDTAGQARTTMTKVGLTGSQMQYRDELGTVTRAVYDQLERVTDSYRTFSGQAETRLQRWEYDAATLRMAATEDFSGSQTTPRRATFGYDSAGRPTTTTLPNGVVATTSYDANSGLPSGITNRKNGTDLSPLSSTTYTRSPGGDITQEMSPGRTRSYTYDSAARLRQVTEGATTRTYSYDANSNRCAVAASCDGTYTYDNADRLTASPFASAYTYDSHGNVISATPRSSGGPATFGPQPVTVDSAAPSAPEAFPLSVGASGTLTANATTTGTGVQITRTGTGSGTLNTGQSGSTAMSVDGQSRASATLTWPADNKTASGSASPWIGDASEAQQNGDTSNVVNQTINATGAGNITASVTAEPGDNWVERSSAQYGQVPALGTLDMTFRATANGRFVSWVFANSGYSLSTLSQQLYDENGTLLVTAPAGTALVYDYTDLPAYGGYHDFKLRLVSASPTATSWYLEADYAMYPTLTTELLDLSGTRVALATQSPTAPTQSLTYANAPAGTYTLRVTSADAQAQLATSWSYHISGRADLTLRLKNPQGTEVGQTRTSSGSATLGYTSASTAGGSYTWEVVNNDATFAAAYSLGWTATTLADDVSSGSVAVGDTATRSVTADAAGYTNVVLGWTKGNHPVTSSSSLTVPAGSAGTKTITPDATGAVSATYAWVKDTKSYSGSGSVTALGTAWGPEFTASANGTVSISLSWSSGTPNPDLDLAIIDKATGAVVAEGATLAGPSPETASFPLSGLSYGQSKTYQVRVTSRSATTTSYTLSGSYPVWDKLSAFELRDASNTVVASVTPPTSGTASVTLTKTNVPPGTYTIRAVSGGHRSTGTLTETHQVQAFADVTVALKNASGTVISSDRRSTGAAGFATTVPAAGTYTVSVTNHSTDLAVPSYDLTATTPRQHGPSVTLSLKNAAGTVVATSTGPTPSISASVVRAGYSLVVAPTAGSGTATVSASYPSSPAAEVITYDGRDHATSIDDGATKVTETLSPSGRVIQRRVVDNVTGAVLEDTLYGYAGEGDSPAYSRPAGTGTPVTTYVQGPNGLLLTDVAGTPGWSVVNLRGDLVGTTDAAGAFTANPVTDEFGKGTQATSRLNWLGAHQRYSSGNSLGLLRMGVRLYDPALGRFLGVDPEVDGSLNAYDYAFADPVNNNDLDGRKCRKWVRRYCADGALYITRGPIIFKKDWLSGMGGCGGFVVGLCWEHIGTEYRTTMIVFRTGRHYKFVFVTEERSVFYASPGWAVPRLPFGKRWSNRVWKDRWFWFRVEVRYAYAGEPSKAGRVQ